MNFDFVKNMFLKPLVILDNNLLYFCITIVLSICIGVLTSKYKSKIGIKHIKFNKKIQIISKMSAKDFYNKNYLKRYFNLVYTDVVSKTRNDAFSKFENIISDGNKDIFLVTGKTGIGKTRFVYEFLRRCSQLKDHYLIVLKCGEMNQGQNFENIYLPFYWKFFKKFVLVLDDIDYLSNSNIKLLYKKLSDASKEIKVIGTIRSEVKNSFISLWDKTLLIDEFYVEDLDDDEIKFLANKLNKTIKQHDKTPQSIISDVYEKKIYYLAYPTQTKAILKTLKILKNIWSFIPDKQTLSELAKQVFELKEHEFDDGLNSLVDQTFVELADDNRVFCLDYYLIKIIDDYPQGGYPDDHLEKIRSYFKKNNFQIDLVTFGTNLFYQEKYDQSIRAFEKAIFIDPDCTEALYSLGNVYHNLGHIELAAQMYNKALMTKPDHMGSLVNKSSALIELGLFDEANRCCEHAINLMPDASAPLVNRAIALIGMNKFSEALIDIDKAISVDSNFVETWYTRGTILLKLKNYSGAAASFERALEIDPKHIRSLINIGSLCHDLQKYTDAIAHYDVILQIDSNHVIALANKGAVLNKMGDYQSACTYLSKVIVLDPKFSKAYIGLSLSLAKQNRYAKAIEVLDRLLANEPNNHEAMELKIMYEDGHDGDSAR